MIFKYPSPKLARNTLRTLLYITLLHTHETHNITKLTVHYKTRGVILCYLEEVVHGDPEQDEVGEVLKDVEGAVHNPVG